MKKFKLNGKLISSFVSIALVAGSVSVFAFSDNLQNILQPNTPANTVSSDIISQINNISSLNEIVSSSIQSQIESSEITSSNEESSTISIAPKEVINTDTATQTIQDATNAAVSQINEVKEQAVTEVKQAAASSTTSLIPPEPDKYMIVNPVNGDLISTQDPNYEKYKAQLGGDAGTVPPDKSTACQLAIAKLRSSSTK